MVAAACRLSRGDVVARAHVELGRVEDQAAEFEQFAEAELLGQCDALA
jgi:hypothetical protein